MKTKKQYYLSAAACLAAALCLMCTAACTDAGDADLSGRTPIILTASVQGMPATRANTAAGQWTDGDVVGVEMDGVVKRYLASTTSTDHIARLRPADAANTHYWPADKQIVKVRAWYYGGRGSDKWKESPEKWSVWARQNITLPNGETNYQWSDFLYAPVRTFSNDPQVSSTQLMFYHQTARVVVRIRNIGAMKDIAQEKIEVNIDRYGSTNVDLMLGATFDATLINPDAGKYSGLEADGTLSNITPKPLPSIPDGYTCCYEALVIPQDMSEKHFIEVSIQSNAYYYIPARGEANLRGGYTYTYDVTVSEAGTLHVTASTPIAGWTNGGGDSGTVDNELINLDNPQTISDNGVYLLTGKGDGVTLNITGGTPTLIVKDAALTGSSIHITGGTPEIRVEETNNTISGKDNPPIWLDGDNANVRITGRGSDKSRLEVIAEGNAAAIGTGGSLSNGERKCGSITIENSHVEATAHGGAAAIGFGYYSGNDGNSTHGMGIIYLYNSTFKCVVEKGSNDLWPAHIGGSANGVGKYTVNDISIYSTEVMNVTKFFENFTHSGNDNDAVVGYLNELNEGGLQGNPTLLWNNGNKTGQYPYALCWKDIPALP